MTLQDIRQALDTFDVALFEARKNQAKQSRKLIDERAMILQPKLAKLFFRQSDHLLKSLKKFKIEFRESVVSEFDQVFDDAILPTSAEMWEVLEKAIIAALKRGAQQMITIFNVETVFSLTDPLAEEYIKAVGANLITGIDNTTKDQIRAIILTAIENGTSYSELAVQIKRKYNQFAVGVPQKHLRSRAELIAVTEIGNAYCEGNRIEALSIQRAGIPMEKYWYTTGDDRVSEGCAANQAQGWIPLQDTYASGHQRPLRFPGCRCVEMYRRMK